MAVKQVARTSIQIAAIALCVASCAAAQKPDSKPDGKEALTQRIRNESGGLIEVVSYQKTNAIEGEVFGVKHYTAQYRVEVTFLDDCYWSGERYDRKWSALKAWLCVRSEDLKPMDREFLKYYPNGENTMVLARKGERARRSGTISFQLTENGWVETQDP